MKHKHENAVRAGTLLLQLATALVCYARSEEHLKEMCKGVWPGCDFYRGGTHLRVLVDGISDGPSFYVEL